MKTRTVLASLAAAVSIAASGVAFAPAASAATGDCPDAHLCLFENSNFQGDAFIFRVSFNSENQSAFSESNLSSDGFPDGKMISSNTSSIKNNTPVDILVFTGANFAGDRFTMKRHSSVPALSSPWNDRVLAMQCPNRPIGGIG